MLLCKVFLNIFAALTNQKYSTHNSKVSTFLHFNMFKH